MYLLGVITGIGMTVFAWRCAGGLSYVEMGKRIKEWTEL